ncbi:MAG: hypothetical protein IPP10_19465 [Candidatus Competibacteraceae bacterium]|nr:hypothetical protein [Candidatus Competibacteraceae bacterium]
MTFRDPKLARYNRVHVSFNDYEIEWLETLLHESGGELARLVHDLAVAQLERYAEQCGLSLDAAVKELVEKQKQKRKSKERPN